MKCSALLPKLLCQALLLGAFPALAQVKYLPQGDHAFPSSKRIFHYVGDDQPLSGKDLEGLPEAHPAVVVPAVPHPIEVAESNRAYADGRLPEAAGAVAALARQQPADPHVLDCYARALYRDEATRPQSYLVYQRLVGLLDHYGHEGPAVVSVYMPFLEAYFKLATLQLDAEQWAAASYNLSRAAAALESAPETLASNAGLREQILQYQTECFAHLHNPVLCRYFGRRTLQLFPQNQYVPQFLAALPGATRPPASPARR